MKLCRSVVSVIAVVMSALFLLSCVSTPTGKIPPRWKDRKPLARNYKPVVAPDLYLEVISERRTYFAGEDVILEFRLINRGDTKVLIEEWMQNQEANLNVCYLAKTPNVDPQTATWSVIETKVPANALRCPLELRPGNSVLLECPLKFIKTLPAPSKPLEYLVRGQLNLKSLPLTGDTITIIIK